MKPLHVYVYPNEGGPPSKENGWLTSSERAFLAHLKEIDALIEAGVLTGKDPFPEDCEGAPDDEDEDETAP